jgi:hypothetical protein
MQRENEDRVRQLRQLAERLRMLAADPAQKPGVREALANTAANLEAEAEGIARRAENP